MAHGFAFFAAVVVALQGVLYTYDGWYGIIYFGEEIRNPSRDVARSMLGGVISIILINLVVNLALLHVMPLSEIAGEPLAVGKAAGLIFGKHGDTVIRILAIVSMLSTINAYTLFFQAEYGIRDLAVTGVQTCALPISLDLTGQTRPGRDLIGFLRLLKRVGLRAWMRPVPPVKGWIRAGYPRGMEGDQRGLRKWLWDLESALSPLEASHGGPIAMVEGGGGIFDAPAPPQPVREVPARDSRALIGSRE